MTGEATDRVSSGKLRDLPSRFALPLLGDTLKFATDPGGLLAGRARELGPVFEVNLFGHPTACFVGAEAFALLLDDENVERAGANPPHVAEIFNPKAIPFLDGAARTRRKRLLMTAFRESALDGYLPVIEQVMTRHARKWATLGAFSWVPALNSLGFSIAAALFVGADPTRDDPAIEDAFGKVAAGLLSPPINLPFTAYGRALKARDFIRGVVNEAVLAHEKDDGGGGTLVLSRLMQARDGEERLSREEIGIETFHFFAAYAAVIGGLSFVASALGQHPDIAARAREEVVREVPQGSLSVAALRKLAYVDRVTREVRRATPVLPMTFFGTIKRDVTFQGIRIPKGHRAIGCIGATLQDERAFPEPARFDPERWVHPSEAQERGWIPHGGGVHADGHRCAGEALADLMMKVFAVHMLRGFSWRLEPSQDLSPTKNQLFATPAGGLRVTISQLGVASPSTS
jgi:cytochrome P450